MYDFGFRNTFILKLDLFLRKLKFIKNVILLLTNNVYIVVCENSTSCKEELLLLVRAILVIK